MALPRRAFLGAAVTDGELGVEITRLWPGSMADRAGAEPGDLIRAFGDPIASVAELVDACRRHTEGITTLVLERDDERREVAVDYVPFPEEKVAGAEVIYGEAAGLRTLELAPRAGATVELVFLPGLPYESVDHALREGHATARFLADLARTGVASLRIERPGLGDSPGAPCHGFLDEQRAYRDALEARPRTRPRVLFGHSVGGMHAPMLADLADGLIVYGTSARRWSDCLAASRDRQRALHGLDPLAGPVGWPSERNKQFHEELDAVDLDAVWRSVDLPKLVVIGEHDWVVGEADQRALGGEALFVEGLDHAFASHPSKDESLAQYGRGSYDERVATGCAEWLARAITSPGASR